MTLSTHLQLPFILPAQALKHITHNEAIAALDTLAQLAVLDRDLATPPVSPDPGDRYIVAPVATGAWSGREGEVAAWDGATWQFHAPEPGWVAFALDEHGLIAWDGAAWVPTFGMDGAVPLFGVNATPDATNRLAVKSDAVLLDHDDVTPGSGDMRLMLDKAVAGNTAALLFQTGYSGRAEIGTAGDDRLHVKVSADGSTWAEALVVDPVAGNVGLGTAAPTSRLTISANAAALPAPPTGTIFHVSAADAASTRLMIDAFAGGSNICYRRANGTAAARTALLASEEIGRFSWFGHGATDYFGGRAYFAGSAEEDWTDSAQSTFLSFGTTPSGGASVSERLRITGSGNVGIGTTAPVAKLDVDGPIRCRSYTVGALPSASAGAGQMIFVSNETGGPVLAFSDGSTWRRVTDRATVA